MKTRLVPHAVPPSTMPLALGLLLALGVLPACTSSAGDGGLHDDMKIEGDPRGCGSGVELVADEGQVHVPDCQSVPYRHNPPASGPHWPWPNQWGVFTDRVIPHERWVHNLEHGGIVFLFNCPGVSSLPASECSDGGAPMSGDGGVPDGGAGELCPEITGPLRLLHDERPLDVFHEIRVLVTADPTLPAKVGAVAWDFTWLGDQVNLPLLRCFRDMRYDRGPEHAP